MEVKEKHDLIVGKSRENVKLRNYKNQVKTETHANLEIRDDKFVTGKRKPTGKDNH